MAVRRGGRFILFNAEKGITLAFSIPNPARRFCVSVVARVRAPRVSLSDLERAAIKGRRRGAYWRRR